MCIDEDAMTIYLTRIYLKDEWDLELESYFKKLFLKFKNNYDIDVSGYYIIDVYQNKNYGYIIKIIKEHFEYLDYLDNEIDMKVKVHSEVPILYEFKDIDLKIFKQELDYYVFKKRVYGKPKKTLSSFQLSKILEMCEGVFYDEDNIIETYGKKIKGVD